MTNVMITGASAGVGRALAERLAAPQLKIGMIARDRQRLEQARDAVREKGGEALVFPLDVADGEAVDAAVEEFEARCGPVDIWVNVAMVTVISPVSQMTAEEYRRVTEVTYLGAVNGTLSALQRMRPRDRGHIVQIGSALAYRAVPLQSAYCAAKSALMRFSDSLRTELMRQESAIDVTVVHLPAVNTPQFDWARNKMDKRPQPVPPVYQPEPVADGIYHAVFHPRREYWLGTPTWKAILVEKLAPWLGDRMMADQGWSGQLTDEPAERDRADNLHDPVPGDYGARGRFSDIARTDAPSIKASKYRGLVVALGATAALVLIASTILISQIWPA